MSAFLKAVSETKYENFAPAFELIPVTKYIDADSFRASIAGEHTETNFELWLCHNPESSLFFYTQYFSTWYIYFNLSPRVEVWKIF